MNSSLATQFDELTNYYKKEIQKWINDIATKHSTPNSLIRDQQVELCEIGNEIFTVRVKEEIIGGPLKDCMKSLG